MKLLRVLRNILLGIAGVILLFVLVIAGIIVVDRFTTASRVNMLTNITYPGPDGLTLRGYLAVPPGPGPHPAVLMIHEFYGLNDSIVKKADELAKQGFIVLAPDSYRGRTTSIVPRAIWLTVTTPREQIAADLDAAYSYLAGLEMVDPQRIGAVGFCFGGTQALRLGIRNPGLAANVIFYGSGLITDPAMLGNLGKNGPVLGIFGEMDNSIPLEEVKLFDQALAALGVEHTITIYPQVGHAFVQEDNIFRPGPAQDAWQQMLAFLKDNLSETGGAVPSHSASVGRIYTPGELPGPTLAAVLRQGILHMNHSGH
jgi:carboxymethylenebutenolidase